MDINQHILYSEVSQYSDRGWKSAGPIGTQRNVLKALRTNNTAATGAALFIF